MITTQERLRLLSNLGMIVSSEGGMIGRAYFSDFNVSALEISLSDDEQWGTLFSKLVREKERRDDIVTKLFWDSVNGNKPVKKSRRPTKIMITMEGGIIQNIQCSQIGAEAVVVDYDIYECQEDNSCMDVARYWGKVQYMGEDFSDGIKSTPADPFTENELKIKVYLELVRLLSLIPKYKINAVAQGIRDCLFTHKMPDMIRELMQSYEQGPKITTLTVGKKAAEKLKFLNKHK